MLYGYACREAFEHGYERVVTYTRRHEIGSSLRAAGFVPVATSRGGKWNRRGRKRADKRSTGPKVRWERWKSTQLPIQFRFAFTPCEPLKIAA
ncbi:XF1762 family protein [Silvibacterium bohemicum]|uniref:XF1762 family protein n=1 Tax=Silvibacterium bohemicum TaxID=1577686 RepID=UPI0035D4C0AE